MAKDNRVCIPKDLIDPVKAEAEKLLLTDDLTSAVTWILRAYFRDKNSLCCQQKQQPALTDQSQPDSLSKPEFDVRKSLKTRQSRAYSNARPFYLMSISFDK